jgi:CMP-N-acetylneuraminic acid synthetase
MKTLAVIPARGGSKGVPRKNIRLLAGKPLLQYTAEAALASRRLDRVILSTDDPEIAELGRLCGLEAPFLRPAELALDETPSLPVIQHAVAWLEQRGHRFDAICLLQPTHPFRSAAEIDACIELLDAEPADAVVTVLPVPAHYNPHWVYFEGTNGLLRLSTNERAPIARRQELPAAFHREGSVYVTRRDVLMNGNSLYGERLLGFPVSSARSVNIDTVEDWSRVERVLFEEKQPIATQRADVELMKTARA